MIKRISKIYQNLSTMLCDLTDNTGNRNRQQRFITTTSTTSNFLDFNQPLIIIVDSLLINDETRTKKAS